MEWPPLRVTGVRWRGAALSCALLMPLDNRSTPDLRTTLVHWFGVCEGPESERTGMGSVCVDPGLIPSSEVEGCCTHLRSEGAT